MHVNLMDDGWFQKKRQNALMFTELGSKSLAANNYRINEDPENNGLGYCCTCMHVNI